jgi:tRNA pseudouridine38-40 synthase
MRSNLQRRRLADLMRYDLGQPFPPGYIPALMSRTYLALLHYDGGDFAGWQRQPESRTVQAELERVLERLCGRRVVAHGAGRTDAGVHAIGMGVSFAVPEKWTSEQLHRALNALLPRDCWVERLSAMTTGFHARKSATGRRYRYDVGTDQAADSPFRRPYEWALGRVVDGSLLQRAAGMITGTRQFHAFAVRKAGNESADERPGGQPDGARRLGPYQCTVRSARWEPRTGNRGFSFHVAADRFLHHMVRFLVGTMVDIALGRRPIDDMATLLASGDNQATSPPAPPQGLYFVAAEYPAECYLAEASA